MNRPLANEYAASYQHYFDLVPEDDYLSLLRQNSIETVKYFERIPGDKLDYRYADGKWTIKEVLMHIIDTERVFSYRGLAAARGDASTPHYRMDEELYAKNVDVTHRPLQSLISEFAAVRTSTEQLYENLTDAQSLLWCNIVTHPMTARAIGYFMVGHIRHHLRIIEERYL
ncbi:MAG TPA: DinB family protein [Blastocatellia bacterium]|nr:DinB family protein [Blastocatellia bacterium]